MNRFVATAVMTFGVAGLTAVRAQTPPRSAKEGVYTDAQAAEGKKVYDAKCASCHGSMAMTAPDMAPLLNDPGFQNLWNKRSLNQLFGRIKETMPQDSPGSLTSQQSVDIVAYILSANVLPAGDVALPPDPEKLKEIRLDAGDAP